jgi:hypothetical protein
VSRLKAEFLRFRLWYMKRFAEKWGPVFGRRSATIQKQHRFSFLPRGELAAEPHNIGIAGEVALRSFSEAGTEGDVAAVETVFAPPSASQ